MNSRTRLSLRFVPLVIAGVFVVFQFLGAERFTNPETGRTERVAMSAPQEEALGLQAYREVLSSAETVPNGPEADMVRRVAERIAAQTGPSASAFKWQVSLVKSPQINAFCLPGGKIVVYTGILRVTESEAGLATVIGHEVAHATARHGAQRVFRNQLAQTALLGASVALGDMDYSQRRTIMGLLGAGARYGVLLPFGRDHEVEADQMGLLYMARAGYDPRESIRFWERMGQAAGGSAPPEFLSTHPSHGTRIDNLRGFMPRALEEYEQVKIR